MSEESQAAATARLEATVDSISASMVELKGLVKEQSARLAAMETSLAHARGGLRVLMTLGAVAGTLVAAITTWVLNHVSWK